MLHVICSDKQVHVQLTRHRANALLAALRRGRVEERPGTPWRGSAKAPNAPVNLPYSPVMDELRGLSLKIERLRVKEQTDGGLTSQDQGRLSQLLYAQQGLIHEARQAVEKVPEWPYIAGLYAVRIPALRLTIDGETQEREPLCLFRQVTMEDYHQLWPAMSKVLTREPRGSNLLPAPAFELRRARAVKLYERQKPERFPRAVADWLTEQAEVLELHEVKADGDYIGQKERPPVEVQAAD